MRITIKVEGGKIADIRFKSYTCPVAVAACSILTEMVKQKTLDEAMGISPDGLSEELGEVPEERVDRCDLAVAALRNAISDFRRRHR